jgi:hypothetical protein
LSSQTEMLCLSKFVWVRFKKTMARSFYENYSGIMTEVYPEKDFVQIVSEDRARALILNGVAVRDA